MAIDIEFAKGWLRGFFDGEGSIFFKTHARSGKRHTNRYLSVGNTDLALMNTCSSYLSMLGIEHTKFTERHRENRKTFYELHICKGEAIKIFHALVGFSAPNKAATLETAVGWIKRERRHYHSDEILKLRSMGYSFRKIADELGYAEGSHSRLAQIYSMEEKRWLKTG